MSQIPRWLLDPLGPLSIRFAHLPHLVGWLVKFLNAGKPARVQASILAIASLMASAREDHFDMIRQINAQHLLQENGALFLYHSETSRCRDDHQWALRRANGVTFSPVNKEQIARREPALRPCAHCGYFVPDWCHYSDPRTLLSLLGDYLKSKGFTFIRDTITRFEFTRLEATPIYARSKALIKLAEKYLPDLNKKRLTLGPPTGRLLKPAYLR